MKKIINEIKGNKKALIGIAVVVLVFAWALWSGQPAPVEVQ